MVKENLLAPYRGQVAAGKLTTRETATNALGTNVDGYVIPMFPQPDRARLRADVVKAPPKTFTELATLDEGASEAIRLQRRQGRNVRSRLRDGVGRCERR